MDSRIHGVFEQSLIASGRQLNSLAALPLKVPLIFLGISSDLLASDLNSQAFYIDDNYNIWQKAEILQKK